MNRDIFDGKWKQKRGVIKQRWGELTDNDLNKLQGRYDQFVGLLQEKYGYTREMAEKEIHTRLGDWSQTWQETADSTKNQVVTAVKTNPWSVVLPALAATTLMGLWWRYARA